MPCSRSDRSDPRPLDDRPRQGEGHDAVPLAARRFTGRQAPRLGPPAQQIPAQRMLARQIPARQISARQIPAQGMLARRGWLAVAGGLAAAILGFAGCVQQPTFRPGPADPDAASEFTQTPSGLRYRILRKGEGDPPKASDTVRVHYVGKLDDGSEFDSSYRTGKPAEFSLSGVVKGWTEGLQLVQPGGMIELQVPPELGYGRDGVPGAIPPGATLNFTVELIEIL